MSNASPPPGVAITQQEGLIGCNQWLANFFVPGSFNFSIVGLSSWVMSAKISADLNELTKIQATYGQLYCAIEGTLKVKLGLSWL